VGRDGRHLLNSGYTEPYSQRQVRVLSDPSEESRQVGS
jgi:hypothetical protein